MAVFDDFPFHQGLKHGFRLHGEHADVVVHDVLLSCGDVLRGFLGDFGFQAGFLGRLGLLEGSFGRRGVFLDFGHGFFFLNLRNGFRVFDRFDSVFFFLGCLVRALFLEQRGSRLGG